MRHHFRLAGLGLLLIVGSASGQQPTNSPQPSRFPGTALMVHFRRGADQPCIADSGNRRGHF
jgi:hypothetical protein